MTVTLNKFYKSFSGVDTMCFICIPNHKPILLGNLTTISYSTYRVKRPVNLISSVNVGGFARGARTVAGTMIMTVLNQHWVNELLEEVPWLKNEYGKLKADELPIFDIMIWSINEYNSSAAGFIFGVDITDEGQIISAEDMFTENTFSFVARDIDLLSDKDGIRDEIVSKEAIDYENIHRSRYALNEPIYINETIESIVANVYKGKSFRDGVKAFQKEEGLYETGILDLCTKNAMLKKYSRIKEINNKAGVNIYKDKDLTNIGNKKNFGEEVRVIEDYGDIYLTSEGYVSREEIEENKPIVTFVTKTIDDIVKGVYIANITGEESDVKLKVSSICHYENKKEVYNKVFNIEKDCSMILLTTDMIDGILSNGVPSFIEIVAVTSTDKIVKMNIKVV